MWKINGLGRKHIAIIIAIVAQLFLAAHSYAGFDWKDLDSFQSEMTKTEFERSLKDYILPADQKGINYVKSVLRIESDHLAVHSPPDKIPEHKVPENELPKGRFEYALKFKEEKSTEKGSSKTEIMLDVSSNESKPQDLHGIKIAIENRPERSKITFDDGFEPTIHYPQLTHGVAMELSELLTKDGAIVRLFPDKLTAHDQQTWDQIVGPINKFGPQLTIGIHFNISTTSMSSRLPPTDKNKVVCLAPGSIQNRQLDSEEARFNVVLAVVSGNLGKSIELAKNLSARLSKRFGATLMDGINDYAPNTANSRWVVSENKDPTGVACNNVFLTKDVRSTVVYSYSFYLDNKKWRNQFARQDYPLKGFETTRLVVDIAQAYYEGIFNYVVGKLPPQTSSAD
jgi:hypothetical protein